MTRCYIALGVVGTCDSVEIILAAKPWEASRQCLPTQAGMQSKLMRATMQTEHDVLPPYTVV